MTLVKQTPEMYLTQEIRFAIVMYGGISLAIYMNGVSQELLKLVRATAPADRTKKRAAHTDEALDGTERVYRKLGRMLSWGAAATGDPAKATPDKPIRTRFVIDILSGSSAGGINAVYLAKALANDQKMGELKDLWIKEGDIGVLINDRPPIEGVSELAKQDPPRSLLNSRRMYWKLLKALDGMDKDAHKENRTPAQNVEELDLYVTATDMNGQPIELQLADGIVEEYRHRNVFHFRNSIYEHDHDDGGVRNDFRDRFNPFLAFAARCTSAHPAAFEPMRLGDVDEVLDSYLAYEKPSYARTVDVRAGSARWRRFFKDYLRPNDGDLDEQVDERVKDFLARDFNDGGVLDNRPFRHATDVIPLHRAGVPVSRKLVYLDPTPEVLRGAKQKPQPNVVKNAWLSLSTLPRYEPIQEDLRRVLERNRLIERVSTIVESIAERDFEYQGARDERQASLKRQAEYTDEKWDQTKMSDMVKERGLAWAGYQHLRVTEVTDDLALLIARVAGLDEESDEFRAVRQLVRLWREEHYDPDGRDGKLTEHAFLRRFDVGWRLRRLRFVLAKTDTMLNALANDPDRGRKLVEQAIELGLEDRDPSFFEELQEALFSIRDELSKVRSELHESREHLWATRQDHPLRQAIESMEIKTKDLEVLLEPQVAKDLVEAKEPQFDQFRELVEIHVGDALQAASKKSNSVLPPLDGLPDASSSGEEIARRAVRFHYDDFANYDMISHPILYSTGVGEEIARIDVFRISPKDAGSLVEDKVDRPKLAGTELNNFGAFFEKDFRTNDILWGRLDGAERIISALLPKKEDAPKREELIKEAHRAILAEEVFSKEAEKTSAPPASDQGGPSTNDTLTRFKDKYEEEYEEKRAFDPQRTVRNTARASRVVGDMLEGYAQTQRRLPKGGVVWVTRITQLFWLLVEVAVPNSLPSLLFRHGLKLLYAFEAMAILLGTLLLYPTIQQFGFVAFAATATVHMGVLFLEDAMTKKKRAGEERAGEGRDDKKRWWGVVKYVLASLVAVLAALGLIFLFAMLGLDLPQNFVGLMTGLAETADNASTAASEPSETMDNALGTILRGAIMFAIVVVFLLVTARGIAKRLTREQARDPN